MKNSKRKIVLFSVLGCVASLALGVGVTAAYFTSQSKVSVSTQMGKVSVTGTFKEDTLKTYSFGVEQEANKFANGGTATFSDVLDNNGNTSRGLSLSNITPGDSVSFKMKLDNKSNIAIKYKMDVNLVDTTITNPFVINGGMNDYELVAANTTIDDKEVKIELPKTVGNDYQDKTLSIAIVINAYQANADLN